MASARLYNKMNQPERATALLQMAVAKARLLEPLPTVMLPVQGYLNSLIKELEGNPRIKLYTGTSIDSIEGYIGNYKTRLSVNGSGPAMSTEIECGDHSNWGSGIEAKRVPLWRG